MLYTAGHLYAHESFEKTKPLILLNIFIAAVIITLVIVSHVSTLIVMAVIGYGLAVIMTVAIIAGVLLMTAVKHIRSWALAWPAVFRRKQNAPAESYLQY